MAVKGPRIRAIRLACPDVEATIGFYIAAFGCVRDEIEGEPRALRLGNERLEFVPSTTPDGAPPRSNDTGFQHCAIVVSDMDAAMRRLQSRVGWAPISTDGPETLPSASGGATAFKFRDPDGHPLELLQFPSRQSPRHWASIGGGPFLGIDHSAITVADADRSITFYQTLGFRIGGRQWNIGSGQGRLDGVDGQARVEVVTLEPIGGSPPHLELLCYRTPSVSVVPAADGSAFATVIQLAGAPSGIGAIVDPDAHRSYHEPVTTA